MKRPKRPNRPSRAGGGKDPETRAKNLVAAKAYYRTEKGQEARRVYLERTSDRRKAQASAKYQRNKEQWYWDSVKRHYGLTQQEWMVIFRSQGEVCGMCGVANNKGKRWHTDHCHETGYVRGILCTKCNVLLGQLGDCTERAKCAIDRVLTYLGGH